MILSILSSPTPHNCIFRGFWLVYVTDLGIRKACLQYWAHCQLKMIELSLSKKVWGFDKVPTFIHSVHSLHTFLLLTVCQAFLQELEDAQQYRTLGLKHNSNIGHSQEVLRKNVWIYVSAHSYTVSIYVVPYYKWENWPPPPTQLKHMLWGFLTLQLW